MGTDTTGDTPEVEINSREIAQQVVIITGILAISTLFLFNGTTSFIIFILAPVIALSAGFIAYAFLEIKYGDGLPTPSAE